MPGQDFHLVEQRTFHGTRGLVNPIVLEPCCRGRDSKAARSNDMLGGALLM